MAASTQFDTVKATSSLEIHDNSVTLPDPNLLISGDYSRSGSDLVITGSDGARVVVQDYFAGDARPTLTSPDGAKITGDVVEALAGPQFPGQYAQATAPDGAKAIGSVATLKGTATATRTDGVKVELKKGDPVFKGDVVETGKGSELGITFVDETVFSLSSDARMVLNELVYQPGGSSNSMLFNLVKGTFGFVSGKIAPSGEMDIQTPVAVMAIRGTAPIVELDINSDGSEVKADAKFFLAVVKGHSGIVHLLDPVTRELLAVLDNPLKGITISGSEGVTTFDLTVADLFFVQTLVQNRIEPLLENLDPEAGPEDLIKKIKNSFDDIFDLLGNTGLGNLTLTLSVDNGDSDPLTIAIGIGPGSNPNGVPVAGTINVNIDVEDNEGGLGDIDAGAGSTNEIVTGALPINFGIDGPGTIDFASLSGTTVRDTGGNVVTSGGEVVTYSFSGNTLTASTPSGVVFTVVINDVASGTFTVQFFEPLDEPIGGTEDEITLSLPFRVTDGNGSATTGTLNITVDDDTPEIGTPQDALADEDDLPVGNMDAETGDDVPVTNGTIDTDSDATTVAGTLNIAFGADDSNAVVNGGTPAGPGDRAVTFATDAVTTLIALGLTSEGDALGYAVSPDGTTLTATAGGRTIFTVTLSDTGSGSYLFDLEDTLDHADGSTEDNIDLVFNFTATDSDGDTADSSFTVTIDDDATVIGTPEDALVDEDDLAGAPNGDLATGNMDTATGDDATVTNGVIDTDGDATTVAGSLNISFGADDGNTIVNGGTPSGPGDRAVTFASDAISTLDALNLTSEGDTITYALSANDTVLTASAGGRTIFTVTLSDTGDGSYLFDLRGAIDHPSGNSENDVDLVFNFTATDSDGDAVDGSFTVTVDDDLPAASGTETNTVEEEALPAGNEDTDDASGNDTDPAPAIGTVATGSLQGLVSVGADAVSPTAPAQFALSTTTTGLASLTSDGAPVLYDVTGNTLTAYVDGAGGTPGTLDPADSTIFTLVVLANGDYTFTLKAPIDHPTATMDGLASGEETLALDFSSIIIPSDQDGDAISVTSAFTINVIDDVPIANADVDSVAEDGTDDATGNVLTGIDISGSPDANTTDGAADLAGADQPGTVSGVKSVNQTTTGTVGSPLNGEFGTLTLNTDGSYVYKLDNGNATVDALDDTETVTDIFEYTLTDADGDSITTTLTVTVDGTNDAPALSFASSTTSFAENLVNASAQSLVGDATVSDPEGNFDGGTLSITGVLAEDVIGAEDQGSGTGQIGIAGNDISFEGTVIGSVGTGTGETGNGENLLITFNADATPAAIEALIEALTYQNSSDTPTTSRVLTMTLTDAGSASDVSTLTVNVTEDNDDPSASNLPTGDLLALQGVPKDLNLEDVSFADADLGSGDLTLTFKTVVGTLTAAPGGTSGPVVTGTGTQTVTVTGTIAEIEAYLDTPSNVQYTNSGAPGDDVDTITLELSDNGNSGAGGGGPITLLTANVDLAATTETFDNVPTNVFVTSITRSGLDYTFTPNGESGSLIGSPIGGTVSQGLELVSNPPAPGVTGIEEVSITKSDGGAFAFESFEAAVAALHAPVIVTGFLGGSQVFFDPLPVPPTAGTFTLGPASPTVVDRVEITSLNFSGFVIDNVKVTSFEDPIVLDLGASGIDLVSAVDGVRFDLDADGTKDAIGWTNGEDGILVVDLDGSGAIEDGSEVLSPDFADRDFATSLDALASLDDNGDGVIDANDSSYDDLLIWVDANHDGVSQDSELANLLDHGIASIDVNATASNGEINGQRILAEGQYTTTTGETKDFAAVGFEELMIPSDNHAPELTGAHDIAVQDGNEGTPVAELVTGLASDADPETDIGIAVTAADTSGAGTWQYRSAGGNFVNFPAIALGAAFLLAFDLIVRFVPDADAQTTAPAETGYLPTPPALTFHAWDGSAGEAGEIIDIAATGTGGQTPFSIAAATSAVEIAPETAAGPFTDGDDTVDLNEATRDDNADQTFTNAGAGNDIVILPDTDAPVSDQISGQTFYGGSGDDVITGGDGDDNINGGEGNDLISGGAGDDILAGGLGTDTLIGGEGSDSFVISELDATDLIADYDFSAGDEIDLSGLFTVYSDGSAGEGQDELGDFVRIVDNGDGAVDTLQVDVDGGGDDFVSVASLNADAGVRITYNDDGSAAPTDSGVV